MRLCLEVSEGDMAFGPKGLWPTTEHGSQHIPGQLEVNKPWRPIDNAAGLRCCSPLLKLMCIKLTSACFLAEKLSDVEPTLQKLHVLDTVFLQFSEQSELVCGSLAALHHSLPEIKNLCLRYKSKPPYNPIMKVQICFVLPRWGGTLQRLELINITFIPSDFHFDIPDLAFLSDLPSLQVLKVQSVFPLLKLEDIKGCTALLNLTVSGNLYPRYTVFDFSSFPLLEELSFMGAIAGGNIQEMDLSQLTVLQRLDCSHNSMTKLDLSTCAALTELNCSDNSLRILDVTNCSQLQRLVCDKNPLSHLRMSGCTRLKDLSCVGSHSTFTELDLSSFTSLSTLSCGWITASALKLGACVNLTCLSAEYCMNLTELNLSGLKMLRTVKAGGSQLTSMDFTGCQALLHLTCSFGPELGSLLVSGCGALQCLTLSACGMPSLSLKDCKDLKELTCSRCHLLALLCTAGCGKLGHVTLSDCPQLQVASIQGCNGLQVVFEKRKPESCNIGISAQPRRMFGAMKCVSGG